VLLAGYITSCGNNDSPYLESDNPSKPAEYDRPSIQEPNRPEESDKSDELKSPLRQQTSYPKESNQPAERDSLLTPYQQAAELFWQDDFEEALKYFISDESESRDKRLYMIARCHKEMLDDVLKWHCMHIVEYSTLTADEKSHYFEAAQAYAEVSTMVGSQLADDALGMLAGLHLRVSDFETAAILYLKLLREFPLSDVRGNFYHAVVNLVKERAHQPYQGKYVPIYSTERVEESLGSMIRNDSHIRGMIEEYIDLTSDLSVLASLRLVSEYIEKYKMDNPDLRDVILNGYEENGESIDIDIVHSVFSYDYYPLFDYQEAIKSLRLGQVRIAESRLDRWLADYGDLDDPLRSSVLYFRAEVAARQDQLESFISLADNFFAMIEEYQCESLHPDSLLYEEIQLYTYSRYLYGPRWQCEYSLSGYPVFYDYFDIPILDNFWDLRRNSRRLKYTLFCLRWSGRMLRYQSPASMTLELMDKEIDVARALINGDLVGYLRMYTEELIQMCRRYKVSDKCLSRYNRLADYYCRIAEVISAIRIGSSIHSEIRTSLIESLRNDLIALEIHKWNETYCDSIYPHLDCLEREELIEMVSGAEIAYIANDSTRAHAVEVIGNYLENAYPNNIMLTGLRVSRILGDDSIINELVNTPMGPGESHIKANALRNMLLLIAINNTESEHVTLVEAMLLHHMMPEKKSDALKSRILYLLEQMNDKRLENVVAFYKDIYK